MILQNKYHEAMEHVQVDEEMRARILKNLAETEIPAQPTIRFPHWKRYAAMAACLAVVLFGVYTASWKFPHPVSPEPTGDVQSILDVTQYDSAEGLSAAVGFPAPELTVLPFTPGKTTYLAYGDGMAEVTYCDDAQSICLRKAAGQEDISGNFTKYETEETLDISGVSITLKGNGDVMYLAVWTQGGYSYSMAWNVGGTVPVWQSLLQQIIL